MITMKRALVAALLIAGALAGSYTLYASSTSAPMSCAECPAGSGANCGSCDMPCCGK